MSRLRHVVALVFFVLFSLLAPSARAQVGTGVVTGTILDAADRKPAGDVVVTLVSPSLQGEQVVVTDSSGFYRIANLPPGRYTLQLEKAGYKPYSRDGIELRGDSTFRINAELLSTSLTADEVVSVARAPTVDVGSSTTGVSITSDFTSRVPVSAPGSKGSASRSFESVAVVAPGAHADDYGVSIAGTTSVENQYVIDGLSVGNPAFGFLGTPLSSEFVQEMNVITGGYMPEYGRSTGGVINAITKTGSNEFHGDAFTYYSPGQLAGWRHPVQRQNGSVSWASSLAYLGDFGADLGGPIVKDKLWFYAGFDLSRTQYDVQRSINRIVVDAAGRPVVDSNGFTETELLPGTTQNGVAQSTAFQAIGKLTWAANDHNRVTLTAFMSPTSSGGPGKFGIDPRTGQPEVGTNTAPGSYTSVAHQFPSSAYDASLKWSADLENKHILVDTTVGWHHEEQSLLPSDGSQPGSGAGLSNVWQTLWQRNTTPHSVTDFENVPNPALCTPSAAAQKNGLTTLCPLSTYTSGGTGDINRQSYDRYQLGSVVTYILQAAGHHVIKAGASVELTDYSDLKGDTGGAQTQETPDGTLIRELYGLGILSSPDHPISLEPLKYHTRSTIAGGFIQDSWSVMDLVTLNVGLRYDAQVMYASDGTVGLSLQNEWSPRAGVIYDPTQAGRAKLFANYARFYENVPLDLADASLTGEPYIQSYHSLQGCNPLDVSQQHAQCQAPSNRVNSPDNPVTSPNRKWVSIGAGSEPVDPNIQAQSSDEFVAGGEYEVVSGGRAGLSYTKRWQNRVIEDMSLDGAQTFFIGNPGYGIGSQFPKATRDYDAVTGYFTKEYRNEWLAQASYTWSYLRGNTGGVFVAGSGIIQANHSSDFDTPNLTANHSGPLPYDHRHDFRIFGAKDWVFSADQRLSTGLSVRGTSGAPTNYVGADPNEGPGLVYILPRGSGDRLPWEFGTDVHLAYAFTESKDRSIRVSLDIFNLFDFQAVTATDEIYTNSTAVPTTGSLANLKDSSGNPIYRNQVNPNFGKPIQYQSPRTIRFGVRGTF